MDKIRKRRFIALLFVSILLFIFSTGCSKIFGGSQENQKTETQDQKKDPPKVLTSMEESTDKIIEDIQNVKDQEADMIRQQQIQEKEGKGKEEQEQKEQEQNSEEQKEGENKQQGESQTAGNEQKQGEGQKQDKEQKQGEEKKDQQPPKVDWPSIEKTIESLHSDWNNYEVQAQKDGASQDLRENFELQLDTLTNWVMSHNEDETLRAANDLYQYYPKFLNLYKHQAPPDIKDVVYNVRQIIIDAQGDKWDDADDRLDAISKSWQTAKARMDKPDQDLNQRVEAAIDDFSRVTREQNYLLVKLKGNVLLKNIQEIK